MPSSRPGALACFGDRAAVLRPRDGAVDRQHHRRPSIAAGNFRGGEARADLFRQNGRRKADEKHI